MNEFLAFLGPAQTVVFSVLLLLLIGIILCWLIFRYIPNNRIGIVEKQWSKRGSIEKGLIALNGEAGFQPYVLRGGFHLLSRIQYKVHTVSLVTITQGKIGYIFA